MSRKYQLRTKRSKAQSEVSLEEHDASFPLISSEPSSLSDVDADNVVEFSSCCHARECISAKFLSNASGGSHPGAKLRCLKTL
jgi:hypothetical protein